MQETHFHVKKPQLVQLFPVEPQSSEVSESDKMLDEDLTCCEQFSSADDVLWYYIHCCRRPHISRRYVDIGALLESLCHEQFCERRRAEEDID